MKNGRELKMGKKYEYVLQDRKRVLVVHNVTEEDVGIYECALADDKLSVQLALKGIFFKITITGIVSQLNLSVEQRLPVLLFNTISS